MALGTCMKLPRKVKEEMEFPCCPRTSSYPNSYSAETTHAEEAVPHSRTKHTVVFSRPTVVTAHSGVDEDHATEVWDVYGSSQTCHLILQ